MTDTVNNKIPFVPENTTDPAAGLNLSLYIIDMLLNLSVETIGDNAPPATPVDGARYIIGTAPTGLWAGQANKLAMWIANPGYWAFRDANFAFNKADGVIYIFNTTWAAYATTPGAAGEINTASNVGTGAGVFKAKSGVDMQFKSLIAGTNTTITSGTDALTIDVTIPAASNVPVNTQTGTAYTLVLTDYTSGSIVEMNNAAANTVTIPPNSSVAFPVGAVIPIRQLGAGVTTIAAGAGVTLRNPHLTTKIAAQYGSATIHQRATDEWVLEGNIAAS